MKLKEIVAAIKIVRREMKTNGIPARSCLNGGHSAESYNYNAELFRLKSLKLNAEKSCDK